MTVHIVCCHCHRPTVITEWDVVPETVVFTCLTKHGGCGGKALVSVPVVPAPFAKEIFVIAAPLTAAEATRLIDRFASPPPGR